MTNKKSKILFFVSCFLLLSAIGIFFGLQFQNQPVCDLTNQISITKATQQISDTITEEDIFEDYTQTSLKKEYNDKSILDELKENSEISDDEYDRAIKVLNGDVKYTSKREFSSRFENDNKIDQVGDIAKYSQNELKCIWPSSEIILTGIYGMQDDAFNVFVEADETTDKLPTILFSQNHGYYLHWYERRQLKKGWNKLTFPSFGRKLVAADEILGGAVYLCNPYFASEQGEISVYIEGGGYYPIFRKGGNEKEFLNFLKEYESEREAKKLLNMAELVTDHAIISTTSSSLYDVYFNNNVITPSENLNLWGNYFTTLFEFNGIPTSDSSNLSVPYDPRNDYVKINFRYMTYYQGSGAYSYYYHIGWYYEHYWFANFYNAKQPLSTHGLSEHLIFGIGHELGHALDNDPRKINETTNNFTAAMGYFNIVGMPHYEQYQPFEKTIKALSNDYTLDYYAYDDGQIMYTKKDYPNNYDHNYLIWWDLEAVFPGFWARFNNYFRGTIEDELSMEEKYVYYSSLATGVDLSDYYERWGFYYGKKPSERSHRFVFNTSSEKFKTLMKQATNSGEISKRYDHFWYADGTQYDFSLSHQNVSNADKKYIGGKPSITKILKVNNKRTIYIQSLRDENHLGYEVMSKVDKDWKLVGFTYGSTFVDGNYYSKDPTYKVVAINRYFNQSEESLEFSQVSAQTPSVCRIDGQYFNTLHEALERATNGQTIYLLADCKLQHFYVNADITIEIDESIQNDIIIDTNQTYFQCHNQLVLKGRANAKIIFDGNLKQATNPLIYGTNSKVIIENVVFRNIRTQYLAGVVYAGGSDVELLNCSFENCKDLTADGIIHSYKKVKIDNCTFSQMEEPCVNMTDLGNLTLSQNINDISIVFGDFDDSRTIKLEGTFTEEILKKIEIKSDYMLKFGGSSITVSKLLYKLEFFDDDVNFEFDVRSHEFEFGTEQHEYNLTDNQYVEYEEKTTGKKYKTGDKIVINEDVEFNVKVKDKIAVKIFYKNNQSLDYYAYLDEIYLPVIDQSKNKVIEYKYGDKIYNAGQMYVIEKPTNFVAIYEGGLTYRYIVRGEIFDVGYGDYGETVDLLKLQEDDFLGWQCGGQVLSDSVSLKGDSDFIAVFSGELPEVYELDKCEIQIEGSYTYSGEEITPRIVVYFNGFIVPDSCYLISCSNNISATEHAQVKISSIEGKSTGSKTQIFIIQPKRLRSNDVVVEGLKNFVYNASPTQQNLTITYKNQAIDEFSIKYVGDTTNAGEVGIEITFSGNYTGEINLTYTIFKADRSDFGVSLDDWVYGENEPSPQVLNAKEEAEITYSYSDSKNGDFSSEKPKNAGSYWIKAEIEASQNYNSAEAKAQFVIEQAEHPKKMPLETITVSRKAKTLESVPLIDGWTWENPNAKIDEETITAYAVYSDKINYKKYRIQITITKQELKPAEELNVTLEEDEFVYDGAFKMPRVIAKDGIVTLTVGVDFDVQYQNNKFAGQGNAVVSFKEDYIGTITLEFSILKAEKPDVNTTIYLNKKPKNLSEVPLPAGFVWENENLEITQNVMTAKAIYVGEDASSFNKTQLYFQIILEEPHKQPEKSQKNLILWLAITISVALVIVVWVSFSIAMRNRKKWWKN